MVAWRSQNTAFSEHLRSRTQAPRAPNPFKQRVWRSIDSTTLFFASVSGPLRVVGASDCETHYSPNAWGRKPQVRGVGVAKCLDGSPCLCTRAGFTPGGALARSSCKVLASPLFGWTSWPRGELSDGESHKGRRGRCSPEGGGTPHDTSDTHWTI